MFLMIDNYDSFVYNLTRYFEELNQDILIFRNDSITLEQIAKLSPTAIIISPGPRSPKESGICIDIIKEFGGKIPILGICLGHQTIGYVYGADVICGIEPVHGKISQITHDNKGVFKGIKNSFNVTRYHSLIIDPDTLPDCLEATAFTRDGVIMGIRHKEYLIEGVQFHPEAELTECGHDILKNFISQCNTYPKDN